MNLYEQTFKDFLSIVQNNPELLTDEVCASLADLRATLPDDIEKISNAIVLWCQKHPPIYNTLEKLSTNNLSTRGPGGPTVITPSEAKEELDNIIRPSKPTLQSESPKELIRNGPGGSPTVITPSETKEELDNIIRPSKPTL